MSELLFGFSVLLSECALLLLAHNAPVKIKNAQGWSPLAEAISYGDRQMSELQSCSNDLSAALRMCPIFFFFFSHYLLLKLFHHCLYNRNGKKLKVEIFSVIQMGWKAA